MTASGRIADGATEGGIDEVAINEATVRVVGIVDVVPDGDGAEGEEDGVCGSVNVDPEFGNNTIGVGLGFVVVVEVKFDKPVSVVVVVG